MEAKWFVQEDSLYYSLNGVCLKFLLKVYITKFVVTGGEGWENWMKVVKDTYFQL